MELSSAQSMWAHFLYEIHWIQSCPGLDVELGFIDTQQTLNKMNLCHSPNLTGEFWFTFLEFNFLFPFFSLNNFFFPFSLFKDFFSSLSFAFFSIRFFIGVSVRIQDFRGYLPFLLFLRSPAFGSAGISPLLVFFW